VRPNLITADGITLAGRKWLVPHEPRAAVVLVHGFCAHRDEPQVVAAAERLHELDLDVITYDARGHGSSGGACTLGDLERHDVAAAVRLARLRTSRVVLVGASMGAIAALRHAAVDESLAGVVVVSCPARWRLPRNPLGLASAGLTRTPLGRLVARRLMRVRIAARWTNPVPPIDLVGLISAPITFVHGEGDRFIGSGDAAQLYARANEPRYLDLVPDTGHAFELGNLDAIAGAVERSLATASSSDVVLDSALVGEGAPHGSAQRHASPAKPGPV
jgi:uncharacterized protein